MQSNRYCPHCKSFDIKRIRRGFIKKYIFCCTPTLQCRDCGHAFNTKTMQKNDSVEHSTPQKSP